MRSVGAFQNTEIHIQFHGIFDFKKPAHSAPFTSASYTDFDNRFTWKCIQYSVDRTVEPNPHTLGRLKILTTSTARNTHFMQLNKAPSSIQLKNPITPTWIETVLTVDIAQTSNAKEKQSQRLLCKVGILARWVCALPHPNHPNSGEIADCLEWNIVQQWDMIEHDARLVH